jgi:sterol 24-C-methyltransferase
VSLLEKARLAPAGSTSVSSFLVKGADALVAGGRQRIFTPMFFTLARKPL